MAIPKILISSQARVGTNVDVEGWITGGVTSASVSFPAASPANGASSKASIPITLRPNGFFSVRFTAVNPGNYSGAVVTATNNDGTSTATGVPQTIYANGTAPVGHAVVVFPPRVLPTPAPSLALDAKITDIELVSLSGNAQSNLPFTIGHYFKQGELAHTDFVVGKIAGEADVPLQFNVKARHFDGSIRHAIISGVLPALAAGATKTMDLHRVASSTVGTAATASTAVVAAGFTAQASITVGGTVYTANAQDNLATAPVWFGGAVATDFTVAAPLRDSGNVEHTSIAAVFHVRYYPGQTKAKVDMVLEHTKAYTGGLTDVTYDVALTVGGATVFTKIALVHYPRTRWKRTFWWNGEPALHIKHNRDYLIDSKGVPNYDRRHGIAESKLQEYATDLASNKFDPMKTGRMDIDTTGPGAKPYLGILPDIAAAYVLCQDVRAKRIMLAQADAAGSYGIHFRSHTGPTAGKPMDVNHFPKASYKAGDSGNTSTGVNEYLGTITTASINNQDTSHQPSVAYVPYMVTGDCYYFEEMLFWANNNFLVLNPGILNLNPGTFGDYYRQWHRGSLCNGQLRGQAWGTRTLVQAAALTPDDYYLKESLLYWVEQNSAINDAFFTDNSGAHPLHIITRGGVIIYDNDNPASPNNGQADVGISNFQEDFLAQSLNHGLDLGFESIRPFLFWKVKWQVSRMIGEGACWTHAGLYNSIIRDTSSSPMYTTMGQILGASLHWPTVHALPCGSQERLDEMNRLRPMPSNPYIMNDMTGYAYSATGFPSNLQPALAAAVDVAYPDADLAWDLFDNRAVKPNVEGVGSFIAYSQEPQFSIVPRAGVAGVPNETVPVDSYSVASGQTMYFGMAAPA